MLLCQSNAWRLDISFCMVRFPWIYPITQAIHLYTCIHFNSCMAEKQLIDKKALARALERKFDLTHAKSQRIVAEIINTLSDGLVRGERVLFVGFGSFHLQRRKSRHILHPTSRQSIEIPERLMPVFRPGKSLKKKLLNSATQESQPMMSPTSVPVDPPPSIAPLPE